MNWQPVVETIKKLVAWGSLIAVGYIGEKGADGGFIKDIWAAMKTASPPVAMFLFFMYLSEQRERREAQKQCNERTIDFIGSTNATSSAFSKTSAAFSKLADRLNIRSKK